MGVPHITPDIRLCWLHWRLGRRQHPHQIRFIVCLCPCGTRLLPYASGQVHAMLQGICLRASRFFTSFVANKT